jgi:hypothetical protein
LDLHNILRFLFNQKFNHNLAAVATNWILSGTHTGKDHALESGLVQRQLDVQVLKEDTPVSPLSIIKLDCTDLVVRLTDIFDDCSDDIRFQVLCYPIRLRDEGRYHKNLLSFLPLRDVLDLSAVLKHYCLLCQLLELALHGCVKVGDRSCNLPRWNHALRVRPPLSLMKTLWLLICA